MIAFDMWQVMMKQLVTNPIRREPVASVVQPEYKVCTKCNVEKHKSEFHSKGRVAVYGEERKPECKACSRIYQQNYRKLNRPKGR